MVVYDNVSSAIHEHHWDTIARHAGRRDILFDRKLRNLPIIGESHIAMELELGAKRFIQTGDGEWLDRRELLTTASMLRRDDVTVIVADSIDLESLRATISPALIGGFKPPSLNGPAGLSRRIDARIVEALDEQSMDVRDLSAVGMERAEDANSLNHWLGP